MNGISFDNIHTWNDLGLILSSRSIGSAVPKRHTVEIPGADSVLDLTGFFGETKYGNRQITYTFTFTGNRSELESTYSMICSKFNGIHFDMIIDDADQEWFWTGYCSVGGLKLKKNIGSVEVSIDAFPYKQKVNLTVATFNVAETLSVNLMNSRRKVIPTIITSAEMQLTFKGNTYSMNAGTHTISALELSEGNNALTLTGNGTVEFQYREGVL